MKLLFVTQQLNRDYVSAEASPGRSMHVYLVTKVVNSVLPGVHETMTATEVQAHCEDDAWKVTIS